jgi:hypothetical protein
MCPIPNGSRYLASNIFLPSRRNAPLSEACESVWSVNGLLWLLLIGPVILIDRMTGQNCVKMNSDEQLAMFSHELQSALMLTVVFLKIYCKLTNLSLEQ